MAFTDRPGKRVTFEEPLFINIVDVDNEKEQLAFKQSRSRPSRKLIIWALASVVLLFLLGGSPGEFLGEHVQITSYHSELLATKQRTVAKRSDWCALSWNYSDIPSVVAEF
jgi:hypothetical protein